MALEWPTSLDDADQDGRDGQKEQKMDETADRDVRDHAQQPEQQQDHDDGPKHESLLFGFGTARILNDSGSAVKLVNPQSSSTSFPVVHYLYSLTYCLYGTTTIRSSNPPSI